MAGSIEEILKIGVLDVKFGPKKYICVMTNHKALIERSSIAGLASEIADKPGICHSDAKIDYDNKSATEQYKDLRPFDEEELSYFKERLVVCRHESRKWLAEMDKKYGNFYNFDDDKRKSWLNEKNQSRWIE